MRKITYREAIKEALREELIRDEDVYLVGEDIGKFGGTNKVTLGLLEEFGSKRIRNTPISEAAIIGAALGSAIMGLRPVAEIMFMDFITIAMDQIVNQVAKIRYMSGGQAKVPLVIRTPGGAGRSAAAQHSQSLESLLMHIPGLFVVMPSTPCDAKGLLKSAIRDDNPVVFVENKMLYNLEGEVNEKEYLIPMCKSDTKRTGKDFTIVATGRMVHKALAAAEILSKEDSIDIEVIDPRTLVPMDISRIVESVKKTGKCLVVHESSTRCGIGGEIIAFILKEVFDYLDAPLERMGALNVPIPFSPVLENYVVPNEEKIVDRIRTILNIKK